MGCAKKLQETTLLYCRMGGALFLITFLQDPQTERGDAITQRANMGKEENLECISVDQIRGVGLISQAADDGQEVLRVVHGV